MAFMYRQTHDTETGVLRYEYWRGHEPGFYYCLLSFVDNLTFWRHQASDHHEGEMQRFAACIAALDLELVDPVSESSPLPAVTARHALGLSALVVPAPMKGCASARCSVLMLE